MKCSICTATALALADRQGVEIDGCRIGPGAWLGRGEFDKPIERAAARAPAAAWITAILPVRAERNRIWLKPARFRAEMTEADATVDPRGATVHSLAAGDRRVKHEMARSPFPN